MTRNNKSIYFKDWTTKKLKDNARDLHDCIYGKNSCYGSQDIQMLDGILSELDNRGVDISNKLSFD